MKLFATLLLIVVVGVAFGDELPQKTLDEIKAQTEKVEDKISNDQSITVDDVLGTAKNATEKVLAQQICDRRGENLLICCFCFVFVYDS